MNNLLAVLQQVWDATSPVLGQLWAVVTTSGGIIPVIVILAIVGFAYQEARR